MFLSYFLTSVTCVCVIFVNIMAFSQIGRSVGLLEIGRR